MVWVWRVNQNATVLETSDCHLQFDLLYKHLTNSGICRFSAQLTKLSFELNVTLAEEGLSCFDKTKYDLWNRILSVSLGATLQPDKIRPLFLIEHKRQNGYYVQIYQLISRITFQLQKIHLYPVVLGTPKLAQQGALLGQEGQICARLQKTDSRPALGSCSRTRRGPLKCTGRNLLTNRTLLPRAHSTNHHISYPR